MVRNSLKTIEVKGSEDPQAEKNLMMALDIIAEWFADAIIEKAKAEVEQQIRTKKKN